MRYAIISDIHGNLEALQAVFRRLRQVGYDKLICLGDIAGYGADPKACIELVQANADMVLAGNHDWAASGRHSTEHFRWEAKQAIEWTACQLSAEETGWLNNLPLTHEIGEKAYFVHSSPDHPAGFNYILESVDARHSGFMKVRHQLIFIGHSHKPIIFQEKPDKNISVIFSEWCEKGRGLKLESDSRYIINVGSVGQPRDANPYACFVVWDDRGYCKYLRVPYDVVAAQKKILNIGLAGYLAKRLEEGR